MNPSPAANVIDVQDLLDRQELRRFFPWLMGWLGLAMALDGYDLLSISYAAPAIIREWGSDRAAFGPVFSAGIVGNIVGGLLFGYLADRIGRKPALIGGMLLMAVGTLVTALAVDLPTLLAFRLFAGIGVGAVAPIGIVMANEFAPRRLRATMVALLYLGYTSGTAVAGFVAAGAVQRYGWQSIFVVGGVLPLLVAFALIAALPESPRFLVVRRPGSPLLPRVLRRIQPTVAISSATGFTLGEEAPQRKVPFRLLFAEGRTPITLLFWLAYFANSIALYLLISWLPVLLQSLGLASSRSALALSFFSIAGSLCGLLVMRVVDRLGIAFVAVLPLAGIPVLLSMSSLGGAETALFALAVLAGGSVSGGQTGLHAVAGMLYPTAVRANGVSFGLFFARVAGVIAPTVAGTLFNRDDAVRNILLMAAAPLVVVALACFGLGLLHRTRRTVHALAAEPAPGMLS